MEAFLDALVFLAGDLALTGEGDLAFFIADLVFIAAAGFMEADLDRLATEAFLVAFLSSFLGEVDNLLGDIGDPALDGVSPFIGLKEARFLGENGDISLAFS